MFLSNLVHAQIIIFPPIGQLNPGSIVSSELNFYEDLPAFFSEPASGGFNAPNYEYTWQYAIDNSPWQDFGNTEPCPWANLPRLTFNMKVRRIVRCGWEVAYTNTIELSPTYTSACWENLNYRRVITVLKPGLKSWFEADDPIVTIGEKFQSTEYLDDWGRVIQTNEKLLYTKRVGNITFRYDGVGIATYDGAGRQARSYLTYPAAYANALNTGFYRSNAINEQNTALSSMFEETAGSATWATTTFENSPLSRPTSVKRPGGVLNANASYIGITTTYGFNAANEVRLWRCGYDDVASSYPVSSSYYPTGSLNKIRTVGEDGKVTISFSDRAGNLIMKKEQGTAAALSNETAVAGWLVTYYIYNELNQLRFVVPPNALEYFERMNFNLTNQPTVVEHGCFYYNYDERGRQYISHSPSAGVDYQLYDNRNRPVLVQPQKLRDLNLWQFILYDQLDRPICSGLAQYTNPSPGQPEYITLKNALTALNGVQSSVTLFTGSNEIFAPYNAVVAATGSIPGFSNLVVNNTYYYDNYTPQMPSFLASPVFPATTIPDIRTFAKSERVLSMPTGSKQRIIDEDGNAANDKFNATTIYYDEKGVAIQVNKELFQDANGICREVLSTQLDWMGKTAGTTTTYSIPGTAYTSFPIATSYTYDFRHRLLEISKHVAGSSKKIFEQKFNEFNQVATKRFAPGWDDPINPAPIGSPVNGIEYQAFSYNIHGALQAINKDYALESTTSINQWQSVFSMYLGYENNGNVFSHTSLDGKIAGSLWRTQGDNLVRKYEYEYDIPGRLKLADFNQREKPTDMNWSKSIMDYSALGFTYDANGNLFTMQQKGVEFGKTGGKTIDNLEYRYKFVASTNGLGSNQLERVFDNFPAIGTNFNGTAGDFRDENYGVNYPDYSYDNAGNMTIDQNKKIRSGSNPGILYNYLNKSRQIMVEGQGTTEYIYSADGSTIAKKTTPVSPTAENPTKTTWYFGSMLFEEIHAPTASAKQLQYITHENGRIRAITHASFGSTYPLVSQAGGVFSLPDGKFGVFDYFITDHLGNLRFVLTEEQHEQRDLCSMEDANSAIKSYEETQFNFANRAATLRYQKPAGLWTANTTKVMKLGGPGSSGNSKYGPGILLKVMAGDRLNMLVNYHFQTTGTYTSNNSFTTALAASVATALTGVTTGAKFSNVSGTQGAAGGPLATFLQNTPVSASEKPRAYLNWLFYDENFNFVPYDPATGLGSYSKQVEQTGDHMSDLYPGTIRVPKNGYAFVYVSNASDEQFVYFDNLRVYHIRGKILEENSYYPHGLRILPISANAMKKPDGRYKFNGIEQIGDFGLQDYNAFYRELDPQIGRWWQSDPKASLQSSNSPYESMGGDPVNNVDPLGDFWQEFLNFVRHGEWLSNEAWDHYKGLKNEYGNARQRWVGDRKTGKAFVWSQKGLESGIALNGLKSFAAVEDYTFRFKIGDYLSDPLDIWFDVDFMFTIGLQGKFGPVDLIGFRTPLLKYSFVNNQFDGPLSGNYTAASPDEIEFGIGIDVEGVSTYGVKLNQKYGHGYYSPHLVSSELETGFGVVNNNISFGQVSSTVDLMTGQVSGAKFSIFNMSRTQKGLGIEASVNLMVQPSNRGILPSAGALPIKTIKLF